jgi:hypothetical protein
MRPRFRALKGRLPQTGAQADMTDEEYAPVVSGAGAPAFWRHISPP